MLASHRSCPAAVFLWPLVRIELRRPAAWLAVVAGAMAGASDSAFAAAATMALAAVAGVGEMPVPIRTRIGVSLMLVRAAWPAAGFLIVAAMRGGAAAESVAAVASTGVVSLIATAVTIGVVQACRASAADTASVALVIAAASIATARAAFGVGVTAAVLPLAAGGGAWLTLAALAAAHAWWSDGRGAVAMPRTAGISLNRGVLPAVGATRRLLDAVAMATTLWAMVAWLVLDPAKASWAFQLGMAWFVCLAVPAALVQDGAAVRAAWEAVLLSAARDPGAGRAARLGPIRSATAVALGHASVLGWPAIVAAVVGTARPGGVWPGLAIAGAMIAAAAVLATLAFLCFGRGRAEQPGETALAIAMALLVAGLLLAPLPIFVWRPEADVEQFAASCQTRHVMQAVRRPPFEGEFPCLDAK